MMDLKILKDTPPWEWPEEAGKTFLRILRDDRADKSERLLAAELAGDFTVINDELAEALLSIVDSSEETEALRGTAAVSLGPAMEHAYLMGFEDADDIVISEETFLGIQDLLRKLYMNADVPEDARRMILEASVRSPREWHEDAVRAAYSSGQEIWKLTAVFCMRFIRGFEEQIIEALGSKDEDILYQAICAAGNWEVDAAWSHIASLATTELTDKSLRLAAIEAVASIRPQEAAEVLIELTQSDDEDIVDAAYEGMAMSGWFPDEDFDDDDEDEKVLH